MKNPKRKYLVEADHPVFKRIYKYFEHLDEALALMYETEDLNYENITINGKELKDHESYQAI